MRILQVIESLGRGGAEQALVNILPTLQRRGHTCEVAALWPAYDLADTLESLGIVVHRLNINYRWNLFQGITTIRNLYRQEHYDIIHAHLFFATFYVAMSRMLNPAAPHRIATFHNLAYDSYPAVTPWRKIRKVIDSSLMRNCMDGWTAVSHATAKHYSKHLGISDITVIPNSFPINFCSIPRKLNRDILLSEYGIKSKDFVFIMPGRFVPEKGHRYLFEALKLLHGMRKFPKVLIFGEGPLKHEISQELGQTKLHDQVSICSAVPHERLLAIIQCVDALVMASTHEGFPLVPVEAMALSKPVLATRVGGLTDLIEDGISGLLVAPADPVELAHGLSRIMDDSALRTKLSKVGRQRIEANFSSDAVANMWEEYYCKLIESGG